MTASTLRILLCFDFEMMCCLLQIGMMLYGVTIDSTLVGGPAYNSRQLENGDVIVQVDGVAATPASFPLSALTSFTLSALTSSGHGTRLAQ